MLRIYENFNALLFSVHCYFCKGNHHTKDCNFPRIVKRCQNCHFPVFNENDESHVCKNIVATFIRQNVFVKSTEISFEICFKGDITVHVFDEYIGNFAELMRYNTYSSATTNGIFKMRTEKDDSILSYECSKFIRFSILIALLTEHPIVFSLRAVTSREHGLMLFKAEKTSYSVNELTILPGEMLKNTVLFLGIESNRNEFQIDVNRKGQENSTINWSKEKGWTIPEELNGNKYAVEVTIHCIFQYIP